MITWLQGATSKHHRLIFSFLLVVIVGSFVFYGYGNRGATDTNTRMYLGYDLNSPKLATRYRDSLSFASFTGQRNEGRSYFQFVAELSLADSLHIPNPSDSEVRKLALLATAGLSWGCHTPAETKPASPRSGERPPAESSDGSLALVATAARILRIATLGRGKDRAPERGRGSQSGVAGPGLRACWRERRHRRARPPAAERAGAPPKANAGG